MVYNTVLTAEKRGPQIAGAQIAGVYCSNLFSFIEELMTDKKFMNLAKDFAALKLVLNWKKVRRRRDLNPGPSD